jgi:filamentous hemagglutinin family protein
MTDGANAQVIPDQTLGTENSTVRNEQIQGRDGIERSSELIEGGARRGGNLFHSFGQFDVPEGQGAYFANPEGVSNILGRVTGGDLSEIFGTLGVLGSANLFLINPNGIVFGSNASLDLGGSFVGTTANAVQFGDQGLFSAVGSEIPQQLLTVNPSAFLFNSPSVTTNSITVQGNGQGIRSTTTLVDTQFGLRVPENQTLALIGGNLIFDGATIKTAGGRIELGSVGSGSVELVAVTDGWTFNYANVPAFQDIQLVQRAVIDASGLGGGNIQVRGNQITLTGESQIEASTLGDQPGGRLDITADGVINIRGLATDSNYTGVYAQAYRGSTGTGDNVTIRGDSISLNGLAIISTTTRGTGRGGDITIQANQGVDVDGAGVVTRIETGVSGQTGALGGNLTITAPRLNVRGAQISSSVSRNGNGQAGNLTVRASDSVSLSGEIPGNGSGDGFPGGLLAVVDTDATGRGGNLVIETGLLSISDGSKAQAISFGNGSAGDVFISADRVEIFETTVPNTFATGIFIGTGLDPRNTELPTGNGGNLTIRANQISIRGGQISGDTSGQGNAGTVLLHANDSVEVIDTSVQTGLSSSISADVNQRATGQGGDLTIETRNLIVRGGQITASTSGTGNAGNLTIRASNSVNLSGEIPGSGGEDGFPGGLFAIVNPNATGQGGNLRIETGRLSISDGSKAQAITFGNGDAGAVLINANDVEVFETDQFNDFTTGIFVGSGLDPRNTELPRGGQGNLTIHANRVSVRGGQISADTRGQGNAGRILIQARDSVEVVDTTAVTGNSSLISALVYSEATGRGGDVTIETNRLIVQGGRIAASTSGQGDAGNLTIRALDSITLTGEAPGSNGNRASAGGLFARVRPGASGKGGQVTITTGHLNINDGSQIQVTTFGNGRAGQLLIQANEVDVRDTDEPNSSPTGILAGVEAEPQQTIPPVGDGGDATIRANRLSINGGQISANTSGQGNAGQLSIYARDSVEIVGTPANIGAESFLGANVNQGATGRGGDINIETAQLNVRNGGRISASTSGTGSAGSIRVQGANSVILDNGSISTAVNVGAAAEPPSNINLQTDRLSLTNGAEITASTSGRGNAGNITIRDANAINLDRSTISSTVNDGAIGRGGNITLRTDRLNLDRANITARTQGQGRAGNITVQDANQVNLNRNSIISTEVGTTGIGRGGNIDIETARLQLNNSDITSSTSGQGNTGTINLNATRDINLRNQSRITNRVREDATGNARTIRLNTPELSLQGNSLISAATDGNGRSGNVIVPNANSVSLDNSRITTRIEDDGVVPQSANSRNNRRSNITLNTNTLTLTNNARITANTQGQGNAGNITVRNAENVTVEDGSTISTAVQEGAIGRGGNINLTSDTLNLENARITARTAAPGRAGNIDINASDSIAANNSTIETRSNNSSSGNVAIAAGTVQLQGNSDIRTQVDRGEGRGGNIALTANSVVAFDDSDIVTSAPEGQGGNITFNTPAFFGDGYQPNTPETGSTSDRVDVDASGVQSGIVTTPDVSFIQNSLADLSDNATDPETLLANSCIVRDRQQGSFTVTGPGGLPERPGNASQSAYPTGTIQSVPESESRGNRPWQMGDAIVEPQGVYRLSGGRLVMGRECSTTGS